MQGLKNTTLSHLPKGKKLILKVIKLNTFIRHI